ncbi:hypothetical protein ACFCXF_20410 [Streptomyces virginiae]|uniref:hypothetical protein n=1 Tax=Streptomyces virginiae TaxID=1961 RepID=UPI0005271762|nr:hypothetical protein [Streptomyces virginiae]
MRNTLVRRTVLTASAVSLALLATACGSDKKDDTKADAKPSGASSSAPAAAAKGKTDAELAPLLLTQAEAPKDSLVKAPSADQLKKLAATTDKAECKPLGQAASMEPQGTSTGVARTQVGGTSGKAADPNASAEDKFKAGLELLAGATGTSVTLTSYDGKGAEEAFAAFKKSGTACAGGYTMTQDGDALKINKVVAGDPVTAGDESVSFLADFGDAETPMAGQVVMVRKGNTLATFSVQNMSGKPVLSKDIVDAQVKKLG